MLVLVGGPPSTTAVKKAVADAGGDTIAVLTLLRIYGSAWGFPNPGLLPNATEKAEARRIVEATMAAIEGYGGTADGQITATRHPAKVIVAAVRRRSCRSVVVMRPAAGAVRGALEGDVGSSVRRRLRKDRGITVEVLDRPRPTPARRPRRQVAP